MKEYSIGVDLGGTNLRAAAVDRAGAILEKVSGGTQYEGGRDAIIGDIVTAIQRLRTQLGSDGLAGVGIGIPGFIQMERGVVIGSANLPSLDEFPIRDEIQK